MIVPAPARAAVLMCGWTKRREWERNTILQAALRPAAWAISGFRPSIRHQTFGALPVSPQVGAREY